MTKPTSNIRSFACMLKSWREMPSSAMIMMCPPSRIGTGSRLRIPRFRESIDIRLSKATTSRPPTCGEFLSVHGLVQNLPRHLLRRSTTASVSGLERGDLGILSERRRSVFTATDRMHRAPCRQARDPLRGHCQTN